jgi:hypothetical protein
MPFRAETKAKVPVFHKPRPGDVVKVSFDPKLIRTNSKQERPAQREALL